MQTIWRISCLLVLGCFVAMLCGALRADAIPRTMAMKASTIADFYVEENGVALELEIGAASLMAFANLVPDGLYERLELPARPHAERLREFFSKDLKVTTDDGDALLGRLDSFEVRIRQRRDEITGQPLPCPEGEEEKVLAARLSYDFVARPRKLRIGGELSSQAQVGFVVYHRKIAVNDFRYLSASQVLHLDWEDPWYSAFESRNLRRAYNAPMTGFLYVEPFEVRKEILVRPKDLQAWIDLGLEGRTTIPVEMQLDMKLAVAEFLRTKHPVRIDGVLIEPQLAQIHFLERTLRASRVIDPPVELDLDAAILGVIFVYPTMDYPQQATMRWDLFNERIVSVPTSAVDEAGPLPFVLSPDDPELVWSNFLKNPFRPQPRSLAAPPAPLAMWGAKALWPSIALSVVALLWLASCWLPGRAFRVGRLAVLVALLSLAGTSFALQRGVGLSSERSERVVSTLLHNVYRAFDKREEAQVYDALARSVNGELLTRVYLETRAGLELANQGGARAKVREVELLSLETESGDSRRFFAIATWRVDGSVGHWGHIHRRSNLYRARLEVSVFEEEWKLAALEVLEEERLDTSSPG